MFRFIRFIESKYWCLSHDSTANQLDSGEKARGDHSI